ncbi:MAG: hypothetical protein DRI46_14405, partial [Chloroflexi bacterium]
MPEMDPNVVECSQCTQVHELTYALVGVIGISLYLGREVPDQLKLVLWVHLTEKRIQIEPLVSGTSQRPIVEIESVKVRKGLQGNSKKAETAFRRFRAPRRSNGGGM